MEVKIVFELPPTIGYVSIEAGIEKIADLLIAKLKS